MYDQNRFEAGKKRGKLSHRSSKKKEEQSTSSQRNLAVQLKAASNQGRPRYNIMMHADRLMTMNPPSLLLYGIRLLILLHVHIISHDASITIVLALDAFMKVADQGVGSPNSQWHNLQTFAFVYNHQTKQTLISNIKSLVNSREINHLH